MNQIAPPFYRFLIAITLLFCLSNNISNAQNKIEELRMSNVTIIVSDLQATATWYKKFLKFKIEEYRPQKHVKMSKGDLQIILQQGRNTLILDQINFTKGKKYVNGIDKIGFDTNKFDSLYSYLERNEQKFQQTVVIDNNLGKRTFIVKDPDGIKLQFFEISSKEKDFKLIPVLFSLNASDYALTRSWYMEHFGFEELTLKDQDKAINQNLFKKDRIILELLHFPFESLETTEFMPIDRDLASFEKITFKLNFAKTKAFEMDNSGNKIVLYK